MTTFAEERAAGIGGSDIAAIIGASRFKTPVDVYLEKIGEGDESTSDAMQRGVDLEPLLLRAYLDQAKLPEGARGMILNPPVVHPLFPWARGHVDGLLPDRIVEAKSTTQFDAWADGVPLDYKIQAQWYMGITGRPTTDFVALLASEKVFDFIRSLMDRVHLFEIAPAIVSDCDFRVIPVEYDAELFAALLETGRAFWENHVLARVPPAVKSTDDAKRLWPTATPSKVADADDEAYGMALSHWSVCEQIKTLERDREQIEAYLQNYMADAEVLNVNGKPSFSWKQQSRSSIDSKALREGYPDLAAAVTKTSTFRVFRSIAGKESK